MAWTSFLRGKREGEGEVGEDNKVFVCVCIREREKIGGRRKRVRERRPLLLL